MLNLKQITIAMLGTLVLSTAASAACPSNSYTTSKGCVSQCSTKTGFPYYLPEGRRCVTEKECVQKGYTVNKTNGQCVAAKTCPSNTYTTSKGCVKECSTKTGFPYYLAEGRKCVTEKECTQKGYVVNKSNGSCVKPAKCPANAVCVNGIVVQCNNGYYMESGKNRTCIKCPENAYCADTLGIRRCKDGYYKSSEKACTKCPAGYTCLGSEKRECPAGTYSTGGSIKCQSCPAGTSSTRGSSKCQKCPEGTFSIASKCQKCPAGTYAKDGIVCIPCTEGTYSPGGTGSCKACPKGKTSNANHTACIKETSQASVSSSSTSTTGEVSLNPTVRGGTDCATGMYLSSGKCKKCPSGYVCVNNKATKCPAGTYASGAAICQECASNTYSAAGAISCKACPTGKKSNKNHTKCVKS